MNGDRDGDQETWRLRGPAPEASGDHPTVALGTGARDGVEQSWTAVPLAGDDTAPPPADAETALLETVRVDDPAPAAGTAAGTDLPTLEDPAESEEPGESEDAGESEVSTLREQDLPTVRERADDTAELPSYATELTTAPAAAPVAAPVADPRIADPRIADPAPPPARAGAPAGLVRFGPGVPPRVSAQAAAVWHGTVAEPPARRRRGRRTAYLLTTAVLLALLGFLLWQRFGSGLSVTGVTVSAGSATVSCDATAPVTATVRTDGGSGTLRYRWDRNDGTVSGPFSQRIAAGAHTVRLPLRWTFHGRGTYHATATLVVEAPVSRTASVSFTYACTR